MNYIMVDFAATEWSLDDTWNIEMFDLVIDFFLFLLLFYEAVQHVLNKDSATILRPSACRPRNRRGNWRLPMQPGPTARRAFRSMEEVEIINVTSEVKWSVRRESK
jgi:hypothetical protein